MKTAICLALASLFAASAFAQTSSSANAPTNKPLRPIADCIATDRINEWHVVDDQTITVRTGPDRYVVKTQVACPRLGIGPGIHFRSSPDKLAVGMPRICGDVGDAVRSRSQPPCAIVSVEKTDKDSFDKLNAGARRHGSGAEPHTVSH
jgi:hypothetical protein